MSSRTDLLVVKKRSAIFPSFPPSLRSCNFVAKETLIRAAVQRKLACVAGVNGEGEGEREKNGVLRARDEGTPATKTPIFSSPPTDFYVIQLS